MIKQEGHSLPAEDIQATTSPEASKQSERQSTQHEITETEQELSPEALDSVLMMNSALDSAIHEMGDIARPAREAIAHARSLYTSNPLEKTRATLAAYEAYVRHEIEVSIDNILTEAKKLEQVTPAEDGSCSECGAPPNNFCDCGKTFLTAQMIADRQLINPPLKNIDAAFAASWDRINSLDPTNQASAEEGQSLDQRRINVAAYELYAKQEFEKSAEQILTLARTCEKVTPDKNGACSECGAPPDNFCRCGKTFLTNDMIDRGDLITDPRESFKATMKAVWDKLSREDTPLRPIDAETLKGWGEAALHVYMRDLAISPLDLKNKQVLDIGAGDRFFAAHCETAGINNSIYSLEPHVTLAPGVEQNQRSQFMAKALTPIQRSNIDSRTSVGFSQNLPFSDDSMDLIVSRNAFNCDPASFQEVGRVLKPGGKAKIYPFFIDGKYDPVREPWMQTANAAINEMRSSGKFSIDIQEVGIVDNLVGNKGKETVARIVIEKLAA